MKWLCALLAAPLLAQGPCSTAVYPNGIATNAQLLVAVDNVTTYLSSAQQYTDTVAVVVSGNGWQPYMIATIGLEQELVTSVTGNTLTVSRGFAGTTAIAHPAQTVTSAFIDACYHNQGSAEIEAIETALGPNLTNVIGAYPYVAAAAYNTSNAMVIPVGVHGQRANPWMSCWSGPVVTIAGHNHVSGTTVLCSTTNDGMGNATFQWFNSSVQSIMIAASGPGPVGMQGPSGIGAQPFTINTLVSPMSIPASEHGQGTTAHTDCWSGPLIGVSPGSAPTGNQIPCGTVANDGAGNLTISWTATTGSIVISASGTPDKFTANATGTGMTILATTHGRGPSPDVECYSGGLSGSSVTGGKVYCWPVLDFQGNVTLHYAGTTVGSVSIQ